MSTTRRCEQEPLRVLLSRTSNLSGVLTATFLVVDLSVLLVLSIHILNGMADIHKQLGSTLGSRVFSSRRVIGDRGEIIITH